MRTVLVAYGTRESQTCRIAEFVAGALRARGVDVEIIDSAAKEVALIQPVYAAAIVCASIRRRRFPAALVRFVKDNSAWLDGIPSAFITVSVIAALKDGPGRHALREIAERFCRRTHWTPGITRHVGGARRSRFQRLARWILRRIPGHAGGDTDSSRDQACTDWDELTRFVEEFVASTGLLEDGRLRRRSERSPDGPVRPPGRTKPSDPPQWRAIPQTHS
jgi:menaquinone-dependent protoporphyrinogen oxidase